MNNIERVMADYRTMQTEALRKRLVEPRDFDEEKSLEAHPGLRVEVDPVSGKVTFVYDDGDRMTFLLEDLPAVKDFITWCLKTV